MKQTNKQTNQQKETYFIRISCVSPPKMSENTYFGHVLKLVEL